MATRTRTTVNGVSFHDWSHIDSQPARQVAAAMPRGGAEGVDRVKPGVGGRVEVWLAKPDDIDEMDRFRPPEGWRITKVDVFETGGTALTLDRDD